MSTPPAIDLSPLAGQSVVAQAASGAFVLVAISACALESGAPPAAYRDVIGAYGKDPAAFPQFPARPSVLGDEFFFKRAQSCDARLARQEVLLCAAERIAAIADAPGVSTLTYSPTVVDDAWGPRVSVRVQPQQPGDRFIARDLALVVLAEMAKMDATIFPNRIEGGVTVAVDEVNCDEAYVAATDPYDTRFAEKVVFGVDTFGQIDPLAERHTNENTPHVGFGIRYSAGKRAVALLRLAQREHVLKGAARLTRKLVDDTIRSDAEQAERAASNAADPALGAGKRWGFDVSFRDFRGRLAGGAPNYYAVAPDALSKRLPYNNYTHTMSMLFGRLERFGQSASGALVGTGICGASGIDAIHAFYETSGAYARTRAHGVSLSGARSQEAAQLFVEAGYAPRESWTDETGVGARHRDLLASRLRERRGILVGTSQDEALMAELEGLAESELEEAGLFVQNQMSLAYPVLGTQPPGDFLAHPDTGGWTFPGALPLQDADASLVSALAHLEYSSLCTTGARLARSQGVAMQGAIGLGLAISRQAESLASFVTDENRRASARLAAAGIRAQVGAAWFSAVKNGTSITLYGYGIRGDQFDLPPMQSSRDLPDLAGRIALVWGNPWIAECAAGLREHCPANLVDGRVSTATAASAFVSSDHGTSATGAPALLVDGGTSSAIRFEFSDSGFVGTAHAFSPSPTGDFLSQGEERLTLVVRPTATSPGRVIGPVRFGTSEANAPVTIDSALKANVVAKTAPAVVREFANGSCTGGTKCTADVPVATCFIGRTGGDVSRYRSVPLENELTSNSDSYENSWRHYLERARSAATRADELGREVIQNGLQIELRKEESQEALAKICGSYGLAEGIFVQDGVVQASSADPGLAACMSSVNYERVYVGACPTTTDLSCGLAPSTGRAHAGLNIVEVQAQPPYDACSSLAGLATATDVDAGRIFEAFSEPGLGASELALRNETTFFVDLPIAGRSYIPWKLERNNVPVMSTETDSLWPHCRGETAGCTGSAARFDLAFGYGLLGAPPSQSELRHRVQGAMWLLARAGQKVPKNYFQVYVPVRRSTSTAGHVATIYGNINATGGAWVSEDTSADGKAMEKFGPPVDVPAGHRAFRAGDDLKIHPTSAGEAAAQVLAYAANPEFNPRAWSTSIEGGCTVNGGGACASGDDVWRDVLKRATVYLAGARLDDMDAAPTPASRRPPMSDANLRSLYGSSISMCASTQGDPSQASPSAFQDPYTTVYGNATYLYFDGFTVDFADSVYPWVSGGAGAKNPLNTLLRQSVLIGDMASGIGYAWKQSWAPPPEEGLCPYVRQYGVDMPPCYAVPGTSPIGKQTVPTAGEGGILTASGHLPYLLPATPGWTSIAGRVLSPQECSPNDRVVAAINSSPPMTKGGIAHELIGAFALACDAASTTSEAAFSVGGPPVVDGLDKIEPLRLWTARFGDLLRENVAKLVIDDVPVSVVGEVAQGATKGEDKGGDIGIARVELGNEIRTMTSAWLQVADNLSGLAAEIDAANIALTSIGLTGAEASAQLAIQQLQVDGQLLQAMAAAVNGIGGMAAVPPSFTGLGSTGVLGLMSLNLGAQSKKIAELKAISKEKQANQVADALLTMRSQTGVRYTNIRVGLAAVQSSAAKGVAIISSIKQLQKTAQYEAAGAANADFVEQDGKAIPLPVNTVLRRQGDAAQKRYRVALEDAKFQSYLARLAIEQRLGVSLHSLDTPFGSLEAPSKWVDDICAMEGIDYERLRAAVPPAGGGAPDPFANLESVDDGYDLGRQFIGDYVTKLENFVDYYNVERPSADSDDMIAVSLREELMLPKGGCLVEPVNLLVHSDHVGQGAGVDESGIPRGWRIGTCAPGKCLVLQDVGTLATPATPPGGVGDVAWLREMGVVSPGSADAGASLSANAVTQTLSLSAGSYLLSYWEQIRSSDGSPLVMPDASGSEGVFAQVRAGDVTLASAKFPPVFGLDESLSGRWSPRRELAFTLDEPSSVTVSFRAASPGAAPGSVLLSNVQLERVQGSAVATPYQSTGESAVALASACRGTSPSVFREAFVHKCLDGECFYELPEAFSVDTRPEAIAFGGLGRRLSAGNHNFRHATLSLNMVGTGLIDCSHESSGPCFSNSVVDFSLDHEAFQVPITSWDGGVQWFDFGKASVNRGRALAAERVMTTPLSSSDQSLLAQTGLSKGEFRGRPLDGAYRLRIWDRPGLVWSRLEDIQFVFTYHSWSALAPHQGGK